MQTGYKGKIVFYKYLTGHLADSGNYLIGKDSEWIRGCEEYLIIGECEVDVEFENNIEKEIDFLQKQKQEKLAEMQRLIDYFDDKIRNLQCLTHEK